MRGINKVTLIGNATRDAELRHTTQQFSQLPEKRHKVVMRLVLPPPSERESRCHPALLLWS